ncbi:tripartite motif-containing protein 40-like [Drosophila miranda]|uniref:tripartite motif-containing protein 40-like n=1 Tax=Drosophila miranda TaxID=7229 RepID=UPI0007E779DF|nr:tripartite motif-containing protein 40-like [Drosophila miranda]XP_033249675.1 tripartite motif-containing protein 40-like [Drosophila miranda]
MDEEYSFEEWQQDDPPLAVADECGLCKRSMKDPVSANCGHVFCWQCINDYVKSLTAEAMMCCPVCFLDIEEYTLML